MLGFYERIKTDKSKILTRIIRKRMDLRVEAVLGAQYGFRKNKGTKQISRWKSEDNLTLTFVGVEKRLILHKGRNVKL